MILGRENALNHAASRLPPRLELCLRLGKGAMSFNDKQSNKLTSHFVILLILSTVCYCTLLQSLSQEGKCVEGWILGNKFFY